MNKIIIIGKRGKRPRAMNRVPVAGGMLWINYLITYEYKKRNGNSFLNHRHKTEILTMSQLKNKR